MSSTLILNSIANENMTNMLNCISDSIDGTTSTIDKKSFTSCTDKYGGVSDVLFIGGVAISIVIILNNLISFRRT